MNLIPPDFDPQSILDPDARAIMADWWEEHGDDERAEWLRGGKSYATFIGGPLASGKPVPVELNYLANIQFRTRTTGSWPNQERYITGHYAVTPTANVDGHIQYEWRGWTTEDDSCPVCGGSRVNDEGFPCQWCYGSP